VTLRHLLEETQVLASTGPLDIDIAGIGYDSRTIRPGEAFFALAGTRADGAAFVAQALAAGATAVVGRGLEAAGVATAGGAARVEVAEPRRALAVAATRFYHEPSRQLAIVGVTGTNGKTTTTWLLESIFRAAGRTTGLIGTIGYRIGDRERPAPFTTPEAPELQRLLREMVDAGVETVAMEVSSHAMVQRRAYGVAFDVVVFTNLTQDHLDYHHTMEAYLDAKLMLFDGRNGPAGDKLVTAVINVDDPAAERVRAAAARGGRAVVGFGETRGAAVRIVRVEPRPDGLALTLDDHGVHAPFPLPLLGRHNAWNAAAAYAAARALGIERPLAERGLQRVAAIPGRLERVAAGQPFEVVVDYAHTPDALARALGACREHTAGRVLLVFGCGGDRDRGKRPLMGRIAAQQSDAAWITSDNPRGEDPAAIAAEVAAGATRALPVVLDRREAIAAALAAARPGDLVLIAGKGHETTQTIAGHVLPFDDRAVAAELLAARRTGA